MWLAKNEVKFPVTLTLRFAKAVAPDKVELTQSAWRTGDYLSKEFAVDLSPDGATWQEAACGALPPTSCICDLPLEAVEWSRRWVARVGDEPLYP
jgi:hypothetical protein